MTAPDCLVSASYRSVIWALVFGNVLVFFLGVVVGCMIEFEYLWLTNAVCDLEGWPL